MTKTTETGHKKNVTGFSLLVRHCEGLGTEYNPSNPAITVAALQAALDAAGANVDTADIAKNTLNAVTDSREILFKGLSTFTSRVVGALHASGVPSQTVDNARVLLRKLRGQRAPSRGSASVITDADSPAATPDPGALADAPLPVYQTVPHRISVSQRSFDMQAGHFSRLALMLAAEPLYVPNETELTAAALQARHAAMASANLNAEHAITAFENANIARNAVLYAPEQGIIHLANDVKQYIISLYGPRSPQYRAISRIQFRDLS